jgi:hypothetical protein
MSDYNQNASYGRALLDAVYARIGSFGNVHVVFSSSDTSDQRVNDMRDLWKPFDGKVRLWTSLSDAYDATVSNNNDVIVIDGDSTLSLSSMLTVSKNRVHFVGLDYLMGVHRAYGQSSKVALGVTSAATDIGTILNTGVRNSFRGIKFTNANTVTEGIYGFVEGGEYTYFEDCEFYKSTDLDVTGAAEFVCNGDSPQFVNCTFGSLADARSGAVIRPTVLFTKGIAGSGKVTRDASFKDCNFWIQSTNTANRFMYGANADDIERVAVIENCKFICNGASSAIPAQNIAFGSALTVGVVLVKDCSSVKASTAVSTTTGVFVDGPVPAADTTGISLQAS